MRSYVNCNLRVLARRPGLLDRHLTGCVPPELGLDPLLLDDTTPDWHADLAARLDAARLPRGLHLPFFDLQPGSADSGIRKATQDRLRQALAIARLYHPEHLIGHAAYNRFLYGRSFADWAARAAETWALVLADWPDHPPLFLENTHETDPAHLAGAVDALKSSLPREQAARVGACLDIGHWYSFAEGSQRDNLEAWIDTLAPFIGHLHLHDNDGSFDQHLGPGRGAIPFDQLFTLLSNHQLQPTTTFEPHTDLAYDQCLSFVAEHPAMLSWK
jgi:sugar phosphate isomerase/epimerase